MHNPSQAGKCHMTKETTSFTTLVNFANTLNMENLSYKKPLNISPFFAYFCSLSEVSGCGCVGGRIDGHKCHQTIRPGCFFKFNGLKERISTMEEISGAMQIS